ncbi:phosphate-repressible phosphate permease [Syncephalastrum racemosum]|uniref:Phosphate transporter n=1 Tax=Syncephalastrum racemosum TaxID=13706 RepID=A0A1X2HNW3_SYNRA|nr:phosphate-repressible phosphate permease [Syncephalastrum racemosum]
MMEPHEFTWIFGVTMVLAFMDAFGIGANDVANAFATSISSGSLTLIQACVCAVFTEFLGALLLGNQTSETIKSGIVPLDSFAERPEMLMVGMMCALAGSASWVLFASRRGWPVSTTHSIVGAIIGMGIAGYGADAVDWSWSGVGGIIASWFLSPLISGIIAAIIYMLIKYCVLKRQNPVKWGLVTVPIFFFLTTWIEAFYIIYKGAPGTNAKKLDIGIIMGIAFGIGGFFLLFALFFVVPWLRRRVIDREDLRWYHVIIIPLLPKRPIIADAEDQNEEAKDEKADNDSQESTPDERISEKEDVVNEKKKDDSATVSGKEKQSLKEEHAHADQQDKWWKSASGIKNRLVYVLLHGVRQDVRNLNSAHLSNIHAAAQVYDSDVEYMFSFLQVITALVFSFAHGSNDVANAVGPLSAVFSIWESGQVSSKVPVPIWVLAYGGIALDIGLSTMGYHVMRRMGNNITLFSPTRGFSTELGAAVTILTCSQLGLPVSSTHCATGATAAVGLCNGGFRAVNWKMLAWCMFAWIVTLPVAGLISGCLYAIIIYSPSFVV